MVSDCIVAREVQLQAQLFTFLKGVHKDLEPYWYKTVEGGDIDVSSLPLLLGMTDVAWQNFAVAAGIARVKRGGLQFKANVFVQLLEDYKINAATTVMKRREWRPYTQLMVQIGSHRSKDDPPPPSLRSHLRNPRPNKPPHELEHHQQEKLRHRRDDLLSCSAVKTAMETSMIPYPATSHAPAGVDSFTSTTATDQVVTELMGNLSIHTDCPEISTIVASSQLTSPTVQTGPDVVITTPPLLLNVSPAANKDFLSGWTRSMEQRSSHQQLLRHRPTEVVTTEASESSTIKSQLTSPTVQTGSVVITPPPSLNVPAAAANKDFLSGWTSSTEERSSHQQLLRHHPTEIVTTEASELLTIKSQLTSPTVQTGPDVIITTPPALLLNVPPAANKDFLSGWTNNMEQRSSHQQLLRHRPTEVVTTDASSKQLWTTGRLVSPESQQQQQPIQVAGTRTEASSKQLCWTRLVSPAESQQQPRTTQEAGNEKTFRSRQVTVGVKEKYNVKNVPSTHTLITKSQLAKYIRCAEQIAKLNDYLSKEKHISNAESRVLHAAAIAHVPSLTPEKASHFIGLSNCAFLSAVGLDYNMEAVMKTSPSQGYLRHSVKHGAVASLLLLADELESVESIYIAVDKAPGSEGGFVKYLTWCNHEKRTIKKFFLDAEGSGGFASEGAEAIANSLRKIPLNKRMLAGQASDNGGGLAIEPLAKELTALGLTTDNYLIANCTLHNAQLSLAQPYERVFGVGKTDVRNALQLLFYAHTLLEAYGAEAFPRIFKATVSRLGLDHEIHKYTVLSKPILSRWWWVGKCLKQVLKEWDVWTAINVAVTNVEPLRSKRNIAASGLHSLMQEGVIRADLEFTRVYLDTVLNHNFEWLQGKDTKLDGEPGFRCREILVRFFHMCHCLENLRKLFNDTNSDEFAGFRQLVVGLPTDQREAMDRKVHSFITTSISQLNKNFERWANGPLFFLASFSSFETAQVVARILLSLPPLYETSIGGDVVLLEHDAAINMFEFQQFVAKRSSGKLLGVQSSSNVMDNLPALQLILVCRAHPTGWTTFPLFS